MKETLEIDEPMKFGCDFCKREFLRETTIAKHICESKRRWLDKDLQGNRIGFQSWLQFYKKNTATKKAKTYEDFIKSAYYIAFVKFGNYCVSVNVINVSRYVDWLLKNQIKIDNWYSDTSYTKYLIEYLRHEDAYDAIHRSVETCMNLAKDDNILPHDILRYGNVNRICYAITTGKISPWMLFQSDSGVKFLDNLNPDHVKLIIDYINPEQWALKFKREKELTAQIKDVLNAARY
jgi:hypothetical protein